MNAVNLFSKLSTKSADYSFMPFGDSSSTINIALYTKGMYRKAYLAARFIWAKDLSVHAELTEYVRESTLQVARREHWDLTRCRDRVNTLVTLAMIEHYAPNIFRTKKSRFMYCNIPESQWYRLWAKRYEVPYKAIESYLDIAWGSVHK
jgi:hypothetical protein